MEWEICNSIDGDKFQERSEHAAFIFYDKSEEQHKRNFLFFGGSGHLHKYNDTVKLSWNEESKEWTSKIVSEGEARNFLETHLAFNLRKSKKKVPAAVPRVREEHSIVVYRYSSAHSPQSDVSSTRLAPDEKQLAILFGGYDGNRYLNDVWTLDPDNFQWKKIEFSGGVSPEPRSGHSAVIYQDVMYIFGGFNGSISFHDVWALDLEAFVWNKLEFEINPPSRYGHTATLVHMTPILLSKCNERLERLIETNAPDSEIEKTKEDIDRLINSDIHYMIVLFGFHADHNFGMLGSGDYMNDVWALDLNNRLWLCLSNPELSEKKAEVGTAMQLLHQVSHIATDSINKPVEFTKTTVETAKNAITTISKITAFTDLREKYDMLLSPLSNTPEGRYQHAAANIGRGCLIVYGGYSTNLHHKDLIILDLVHDCWIDVPRMIKVSNSWPSARRSHVALFDPSDQTLIIHGGISLKGKIASVATLNCSTLFELCKAGVRPSLKRERSGSNIENFTRARTVSIKSVEDMTLRIKKRPKDPTAYFERCNAYIKVRMWDKAFEDIEIAISLAPNNPLFRLNKAVVQYQRNEVLQAKTIVYEAVPSMIPTALPSKVHIRAFKVYVKCLLDDNKLEDAYREVDKLLGMYTKCIAEAKGDSLEEFLRALMGSYKLKATVQIQQENYDAALETISQAKQYLEADHSQEKKALFQSVLNFLQTKKSIQQTLLDKLHKILEQISDQKQRYDSTEALFKSACVHLNTFTQKQKQSDTGTKGLHLKISPVSPTSDYDLTTAIALLEKSLQSDGKNLKYLNTLCWAYALDKQFSNCLKYATMIIENFPNYWIGYYYAGICNMEMRKIGICLEQLAQAQTIYTGQALNNQLVKEIEKDRNADLEINTAIEEAAKRKDNYDQALKYYKVADNLCNQKMYEEALDNIDKAIELDSTNAGYREERVQLLCYLNNFIEAYEEAVKSMEIAPKSIYSYISQVIALRHLNKYSQAISIGERGLLLEPENDSLLRLVQDTRIQLQNKKTSRMKFERSQFLLSQLEKVVFKDNSSYPILLSSREVQQSVRVLVSEPLELIDSAITLYKYSEEYYLVRAKCHYILRNYIHTISNCKEAVRIMEHICSSIFFSQSIMSCGSPTENEWREEIISRAKQSTMLQLTTLAGKSYANLHHFAISVEYLKAAIHSYTREQYSEKHKRHLLLRSNDVEEVNKIIGTIETISEERSLFDKLHEEGRQLCASAKYSKAIPKFEKAISASNGSQVSEYFDEHDRSTTYFDKAEAHYALGEWFEAIRDAKRAIQLIPEYPHYYVLLCKALLKQHNYSEALNICLTALNMYCPRNQVLIEVLHEIKVSTATKDAEKLSEMGFLAVNDRTWDVAIKNFETSLLIRQGDVPTLLGLAEAYLNSQNLKKALYVLHKVLMIDPNNINAMLLQIQCYEVKRSYGKAKNSLQEILNDSKVDKQTRVRVQKRLEEITVKEDQVRIGKSLELQALDCLENGDLSGAYEYYSKAIKSDPDDPQLLYERSKLLVKLHKLESALEDTNAALRINPSLEQGYIQKVNILLDMSEYAEARATLDLAYKKLENTESITILKEDLEERRTRLIEAETNYKLANEYFQQYKKLGKDDKSASTVKPQFSKTEALTKAQDLYRHCSDLEPLNKEYLNKYIASLLESRKDKSKQNEAIFKCSVLAEMHPEYVQSYVYASLLNEKVTDDMCEAIYQIVVGLEYDPTSQELQERLLDIIENNEEENMADSSPFYTGLHRMNTECSTIEAVSNDDEIIAENIGVEDPEALETISLDELLNDDHNFLNNLKPAQAAMDDKHLEQIQSNSVALRQVASHTESMLIGLARGAYEILQTQQEQSFITALQAIYVAVQSDQELFDRYVSRLAEVLNIDNTVKEKHVQAVYEQDHESVALSLCTEVYNKFIKLDDHPLFSKSKLLAEREYESWKKFQLDRIGEILKQYNKRMDDLGVTTFIIPNNRFMHTISQICTGLSHISGGLTVAESSKSGEHDDQASISFRNQILTLSDDAITLAQLIGHYYSFGQLYPTIMLLEKVVKKLDERTIGTEVFNVYKVMLQVSRLLVTASTSSELFLSKIEIVVLEQVYQTIEQYVIPTIENHWKSSNDKMDTVIMFATKLYCLIYINRLISAPSTSSKSLESFKSKMKELIRISARNTVNYYSNKILSVMENKSKISSVIGLQPVHLIALVSCLTEQIQRYEMRFERVFPKSLGIMSIVAREYYIAILRQTESLRSRFQEHNVKSPHGLFQLPGSLQKFYEVLSEYSPSLSPFKLCTLFTPHIYDWLDEYEVKMQECVKNALKVQKWQPINEDHLFTTAVIDVFTGIDQGRKNLQSVIRVLIEDGSNPEESFASNISQHRSQSRATTNLSPLLLIYASFADAMASVVFTLNDMLVNTFDSTLNDTANSQQNLSSETIEKLCLCLNNILQIEQRLQEFSSEYQQEIVSVVKKFDELFSEEDTDCNSISSKDTIETNNTTASISLISDKFKITCRQLVKSRNQMLNRICSDPISTIKKSLISMLDQNQNDKEIVKTLFQKLDKFLSDFVTHLEPSLFSGILNRIRDCVSFEMKSIIIPEDPSPLLTEMEVKRFEQIFSSFVTFLHANGEGIPVETLKETFSFLSKLMQSSLEPSYQLISDYTSYNEVLSGLYTRYDKLEKTIETEKESQAQSDDSSDSESENEPKSSRDDIDKLLKELDKLKSEISNNELLRDYTYAFLHKKASRQSDEDAKRFLVSDEMIRKAEQLQFTNLKDNLNKLLSNVESQIRNEVAQHKLVEKQLLVQQKNFVGIKKISALSRKGKDLRAQNLELQKRIIRERELLSAKIQDKQAEFRFLDSGVNQLEKQYEARFDPIADENIKLLLKQVKPSVLDHLTSRIVGVSDIKVNDLVFTADDLNKLFTKPGSELSGLNLVVSDYFRCAYNFTDGYLCLVSSPSAYVSWIPVTTFQSVVKTGKITGEKRIMRSVKIKLNTIKNISSFNLSASVKDGIAIEVGEKEYVFMFLKHKEAAFVAISEFLKTHSTDFSQEQDGNKWCLVNKLLWINQVYQHSDKSATAVEQADSLLALQTERSFPVSLSLRSKFPDLLPDERLYSKHYCHDSETKTPYILYILSDSIAFAPQTSTKQLKHHIPFEHLSKMSKMSNKKNSSQIYVDVLKFTDKRNGSIWVFSSFDNRDAIFTNICNTIQAKGEGTKYNVLLKQQDNLAVIVPVQPTVAPSALEQIDQRFKQRRRKFTKKLGEATRALHIY